MTKRGIGAIAMAGLVALGPAAAARATTDPALLERLNALEQEVGILKRQLEVKQEADEAKAKTAPIVGAGADGFYLRAPDKSFEVKLRGYVQADGRFFEEGEQSTGSDTFLMRRVRPIVEGTLGEYVGFRVMPDFGEGQARLFDAYGTLNYWNFAQIQGGKYKPPVGLERLQSATALMFVERAFPTQLAPSRDIGFSLNGDPWNGLVTYQVGAFNGVRDNGNDLDTDTNDGKTIDARVFAHPFQEGEWEFLRGLGIGAAGSWGDEFPVLPVYRSAGNQTFFQYLGAAGRLPAVQAAEDHWRIYPQGYYYYGPFGFMAEWVKSEYDLKRGTATGTAKVRAWQAAASWVLTGENASFKGVVPRSSLTPTLSSFGAFEIAARYTGWEINDDVFPVFANPAASVERAQAWAVGLNWYPNRWLKFQLDYERTWYDGGAPGSNNNRLPEGVILTRMQVAY